MTNFEVGGIGSGIVVKEKTFALFVAGGSAFHDNSMKVLDDVGKVVLHRSH